MNLIFLTICLYSIQYVNSLNLNDIKKMKTQTTKLTTPTTVSTTTTQYIEFSVVDPGPMMIECSSECASGWLYYNSYCYKKYNEAKTFADAQTACRNLGADLVNIDSFAKNEALRKAYDTNAIVDEAQETWIGLKYTSGSWAWSGGSTASYLNWAPTEPKENQCAQMITDALNDSTYQWQRGGWKSYDCTKTSASYICEQPVIDWD